MARRTLIQLLTTLVYNGNLSGFWQGKIYQGATKRACLPGLNCYSCPGALGACPIGSLQSSLAGTILRFPFYVLGLLLIFGLLCGRMICGWFCPFGFFQDLLHKIPSPKIAKNNFTKRLTALKYFIALLFVIVLPIGYYLTIGVGVPTFCKFICPAGTLEAGLPLTLANPALRSGLGGLFVWKVLLLALLVVTAVVIYRPFCRFICPLGAWYSLYNKLAKYGITVDEAKSIHCQACIKTCQMDCTVVGDRECINCGKCRQVCPTQAIHFKK